MAKTKKKAKPNKKFDPLALIGMSKTPRKLNSYSKYQLKLFSFLIGRKEKYKALQKIASYMRVGVKLNDALERMAFFASNDGKNPNAPLPVMLRFWLHEIEQHGKLARAIRPWMSNKEYVLIAAGERAGKLSEALKDIQYIGESQKQINAAVRMGLAMPLVLLLVLFATLHLVSTQIIPVFDQIVPMDTWTGDAKSLGDMSQFYDKYGMISVTVFFALCFMGYLSLPYWTGKIRTFLDQYPPFSMYRLQIGTGFMLSLAGMISSGIPLNSAIRIIMKDSNPWYKEKLSPVAKDVEEGVNLGHALKKTGHQFPDKELIFDLQVFSGLSGFEDVLKETGYAYLDESVEKIKAQARTLNMTLVVIAMIALVEISGGVAALQMQMQAGLR